MATRPGMAERTLSISSFGKTFSFTGWKTGWATGPAPLVSAAQAAHQFLTYCTPGPIQQAVAMALRSFEDDYIEGFQAEFTERRDLLVSALRDVGLLVEPPRGTYFALADFRPVFQGDDRAFAYHLTREVGVACIPPTSFYPAHPDEGRHLARFAFCKDLTTLRKAASRLRALEGPALASDSGSGSGSGSA